jgi:hypothetical protein
VAAWIIAAVALIVVGLAVGSALVIGAPFLAIPILVGIAAGWYLYAVVRRSREATSLRRRRDDAGTGGTDFTERDRETLTPTQDSPTGGQDR